MDEQIARVLSGESKWCVVEGDALDVLAALPAGCVDAVVTDPPYAEIDRDYGRLTEPEWHALMRAVVYEAQRVLTARGSAVYILQPNSERVGRMRPWLWEFMAWTAREIGQVQDAWWWNTAAMPTVHCHRERGLMRPSVKSCVWLGPEDCYRDQGSVLWNETDSNAALRAAGRMQLVVSPSGHSVRHGRIGEAAAHRGGVTPFNVIPVPNTGACDSAGTYGHGAGTPYDLAAWWVRYLCPRGGIVLDPFGGSGTMALAALNQGRRVILVEREPEYAAIARARCNTAFADPRTLDAISPVRVSEPDFGPLFR